MFQNVIDINKHAASIYGLSSDGQFIYSASADKFVARWNIVTGEQDKFSIKLPSSVYAVEFIHSHNYLAVGCSNGDFHLFNLSEKNELFAVAFESAIFTIKFLQKSQQIFIATNDGFIHVFDIELNKKVLSLPLNCGKIRRLAFNKSQTQMAVACQDGFVRIFDCTYFNELNAFFTHQNGVCSLVFHPEIDEILYSGGKDALIKKWDLTNQNALITIPAHNYAIYDLLVLDNLLVSASRDKSIKIFDLESLNFVEKLNHKSKGHRHSVNVLLKLDNQSFVSGSDDKRLIVWKNSTD